MSRPSAKGEAVLRSPAKINLFLRLTGRRPDGYHELVSLFAPVSLYDTVSLALSADAPPGIRVECPYPGVPEDGTNLAAKAAEAFFHKTGSPASLLIRIEKTIPPGAGLGGGSGNAAAVLTGLNRLMGNPLAPEELTPLALKLGADVPFFLEPRPSLAEGVGERLTPVPGIPEKPLVIVYPGVSLSTREVYQNSTLALTRDWKTHSLRILKERPERLFLLLGNDLEEAAVKIRPEILAAKAALMEAGAQAAAMTGSGSAFFGLFPTMANASEAGRRIRKTHPDFKVFSVRITSGPHKADPENPAGASSSG